jgi:AraC-like DNA-binding protein
MPVPQGEHLSLGAKGRQILPVQSLAGGSSMSVVGSSKEPEPSRRAAATDGLGSRETLLTALAHMVTERFTKLTGLIAVIKTVDLPGAPHVEALPMAPAHPLCADAPDREYCRQSWRSHMAELALRPEVYQHKCDFGKLCAVVPVTWHRRCVAVCRLVCDESMGQETFDHHVEILAVLVENFAARHGDRIPHALPGKTATQGPPHEGTSDTPAATPPLHPKVRIAIDYIDEHLRDIDLSAASVSRHLEMNATYLAHLFAEQAGMRMNRYIAGRRVEVAMRLLAATTWQVKRIARESGYANPDWFGHVFHAHTGMKPGDYRKRARNESPSTTDE